MTKMLTEKAVLKKLDIKDFRHLNKEKVVELTSMIDRLDPEVAKKIVEQFPEYMNTMKEVLSDFKENLNSVISSNDSSVQEYYKTAGRIIDCLETLLDKDDLTFEERIAVIEQMKEVQKMIHDKDSENKKFLFGLVKWAAGAIGFVTIGACAVLGINLKKN